MAKLSLQPGQKFNRYTVVKFWDISKNLKRRYQCQCDCGNVRVVVGSCLINGHQKSCRCLKRELAKERATTHGHTKTGKWSPEYTAWCNIKIRCTKTNAPNYKWYGGRGIKVCEQWMHSFTNFLADMGPKPEPTLTIDRIDNNRDYEPGNCKWSTMKEQCANRRPRSR